MLKKELLDHLRARRTIRRSRHASMKQSGLGQIKDAISIRERPASVEERAGPGHWEGDLIGGSKNSYVATLVERHSRYFMLIKVANKDTEGVVTALIKHSQKRLKLATDVEVYFCDPRSPWRRGSNETPTDCCASICLAARTCRCTATPSSMPSPGSSTSDQERPCSIRRQRRSSPSVLQRSAEPAVESGPGP